MGALAPLPQWIPEDDLLLKNAVEAGASLESLAKGAVRFSRKFTIKELQDRWRSLLYDPEISAEASARMITTEIEASISNHLKTGKTFNFRGKERVHGKRKGDSVRDRYYAMRKRVCNVPYHSAGLAFPIPAGTGISFGGEKSMSMHLDGNCLIGETMSDPFDIPGSGFGLGHDAFPELLKDDSDTAHANDVEQDYNEGHVGIVENQISDEIIGSDGSLGLAGEVPPLPDDNGARNKTDQDFEHIDQKEGPQANGENLQSLEKKSDIQDISSPLNMSIKDLNGTGNTDPEPFSTFVSENDSKKPPCSSFLENQNMNPEVSDCSGSLHNIGFSSPLASMSIWGGIDTSPTLPLDSAFNDREQRSTTVLMHPAGDTKEMIPEAADGAGVEQHLHEGLNLAPLADPSTIEDGALVDLSFAFENAEGLFLLVEDEKDIIDESCLDTLNAIFSDSPSDNIYCSTEHKKLDVLGAHNVISDADHHGESRVLAEGMYSGYEEHHGVHDSVGNMQQVQSKSLSNEPFEGLVFCNLNTEDSEIPCNDDVILPNEVIPPVSSLDLELDAEVTGLVNVSDEVISDDRRGMKKENEASVEPFVSSVRLLSPVHTKLGLMHPSDDCRIKTEFSEAESLCIEYRIPGISSDNMNMHSPTPVDHLRGSVSKLKDEVTDLKRGKCRGFINSVDSFLEKPGGEYGHSKSNGRERDFADLSQVPAASDHEEKISYSEDEVPNFSDIEAMILDMDLDLSDQESCLFAREVSRYQYLDTKKVIMRLEQGAQSYMRRAIASHGAFAVLYGRRLKHYIKKPEVSLGRGTVDIHVDIDLKREGPANKISRRQAIIKMDEHGSFYLKNSGKCSILINGKEVLSGMQLNINSGCLIEIRGMKFIFEVNQSSVCQYLASLQSKM